MPPRCSFYSHLISSLSTTRTYASLSVLKYPRPTSTSRVAMSCELLPRQLLWWHICSRKQHRISSYKPRLLRSILRATWGYLKSATLHPFPIPLPQWSCCEAIRLDRPSRPWAGTLQRRYWQIIMSGYDRPGNKLNGMEWNGTTGASYIIEPQIDHQPMYMCSPSARTATVSRSKAPQRRTGTRKGPGDGGMWNNGRAAARRVDDHKPVDMVKQ